MHGPILVTYATRQGSTAEIAAAIGDVLAEAGVSVDVLAVGDVDTVAAYCAAVIGSPIHSGAWLPEAVAFVNQHRAALTGKPVACFVVGMPGDGTDGTRQAKAAAIDTIRVMLKPLAVGVFGGAMDYASLPAITRLQVQTKGLPEGDFRDWAAIREWTATIRPALVGEA